MHEALHPFYDAPPITVDDHIREFGNDKVPQWKLARCPVCNQRLRVDAVSSVDSVAHFSHQANLGFCPTKAKAGAPYAGKYPRHPDPEAARRMKAAFREHWIQHFSMLEWLVTGLHVDEFIEVIQLANKERIWEYAQLQEFQLPYIFATLMDFSPSKGFHFNGTPKRKKWIRNWFDASVRCYDDLWIHRAKPLRFWSAWYVVPNGRRKPNIEDLESSSAIELESDFLSKNRKVNSYVTDKVTSWLEQNFQVR